MRASQSRPRYPSSHARRLHAKSAQHPDGSRDMTWPGSSIFSLPDELPDWALMAASLCVRWHRVERKIFISHSVFYWKYNLVLDHDTFRLELDYRGWTPPKQPKMKVKFRGCQHTGCWICSTVISKPPSKLYFGFKIVMIFARQPPDSLLTASWQPLENFRRLLFLGIFVLFGLLTRENMFGQQIFFHPDSLLTAWQRADSQGVFTLCTRRHR